MIQTLTEPISSTDWNATPPAVQQRLLALEREMNAVREQRQRLEHARQAEGEEHRHRIQRYHALVEQQFFSGLTPEEQQEIKRLGRGIDAVNTSFYPSLTSLAKIIAERRKGVRRAPGLPTRESELLLRLQSLFPPEQTHKYRMLCKKAMPERSLNPNENSSSPFWSSATTRTPNGWNSPPNSPNCAAFPCAT